MPKAVLPQTCRSVSTSTGDWFILGTARSISTWMVCPCQQCKCTASRSASTSHAVPSPQVAFPQSFTGNLQGLLRQNGPDANGNVTLQLDLKISNGPAGYVQVILQGQTGGNESEGVTITSSRVMLASSGGQLLYAGPLSNFSGERRWNMTAMLTRTGTNSTSPLPVQVTVLVEASGQVTGKSWRGAQFLAACRREQSNSPSSLFGRKGILPCQAWRRRTQEKEVAERTGRREWPKDLQASASRISYSTIPAVVMPRIRYGSA